MSRITVFVNSIWFDCPECGKKNVTDSWRPEKCTHCKQDLSYYKLNMDPVRNY